MARERTPLQMHRASCLIQSGHVADGLRYAADVLDELPADQHNALLYEVARRVVAVRRRSDAEPRPAICETGWRLDQKQPGHAG